MSNKTDHLGRRYDEWLIQDIMPRREVHLIVGPAGAGKTTFTLQMLEDFVEGHWVLGKNTFPCPVVFVSCDRSEADHFRTLDRIGIEHGKFQFFGQRDNPTTVEVITETCARNWPGCLVFIDGFATLVPGGKHSDYDVVSNFLRTAGKACEKYDITILGSLHATKAKEGEKFTDPRQRALGSAAWGGFSDLMIVIDREDPDNATEFRRVSVLPRNAREYVLRYEIGHNGRMVISEDLDENNLLSLLEFWLNQQPVTRIIPTAEFIEQGKAAAVSARSVERWLSTQLELGHLIKDGKGKYRRVAQNEIQ